jgi:hypothetical protein
MNALRRGLLLSSLFVIACSGELSSGGGGGGPTDGPDAGGPAFDELDRDKAEAQFVTTTDIMRYVVAPGCAAETNECHSNEDFPDMSSEGNLWNLRELPCNVGVGDRETIEDYCEQIGDQLRVTDGANAGYTATIGSITLVTDELGEFLHYELVMETVASLTQTDATYEILRNGIVNAALGGGSSLQAAGSTTLRITDPDDIADPATIRQGDENKNGVFGDGQGMLVKPGDARASYLVHRLLGAETARIRMPLNENADNPTEQNRLLSPNEMYAIMSWINCMQPDDGLYSPVRYDCEANTDNDGEW